MKRSGSDYLRDSGARRATGEAAQTSGILRIDALGVADGDKVWTSPGSLLLDTRDDRGDVLAVGSQDEVNAHPAARVARVIYEPAAVLIPGLVNAHSHLDLTHVGPRTYDREAGFVGWIKELRASRAISEESIAASVLRGVELLRKGGTVAVGDIAGAARGMPTLTPWVVLRDSGMRGVSFVEFFAIGHGEEAGLERMRVLIEELNAADHASSRIRVGLQPHAPATVSRRAYLWVAREAMARGMPISTHLAETIEEREFVSRGTGPLRSLLESVGVWSESVLEDVGHGATPVVHVAEALREARFVLAHVNDVDDAGLEALAESAASVAYCPRASEYFGAHERFGPHRYREMQRAGINVCLGTDSIINLPASDIARGGISVLDEMRLLHRRDGTDARTLLRMGGINGAAALGLDVSCVMFSAGCRPSGVLAVDVMRGSNRLPPLESLLMSDSPPRFLWCENRCCGTEIHGGGMG